MISSAVTAATPARPPVVVIVGPTGVGKTAFALAVAPQVGAEIVNADSLQVYRELDIGTAKPTLAEQTRVRHHLLDVVTVDEEFDAARFCQLGRAVLAELQQRGVLPLVVGGSGLYIRALLYGLFADGVKDRTIRQQLQEEEARRGLAALYAELRQLDPETAARLHPHDAFRIRRALEVIRATGRPLSEQQRQHGFASTPYRILKIGLNRPRPELYARIDARVDEMLAQGFLQEVKGLLSRYPPHLKPLQSLGYRHLAAYLRGEMPWDEAIRLLKRDTRRYAKRQLTWFRADPEIHWLHPEQVDVAVALIKDFLAAAPASPQPA